jgi:4-amino-4-deoxy-L-arabinose transferase-like glycosyltransferase
MGVEMPDIPLDNRSRLRRAAPVALVAAALLVAIVIINPFREMLSQDDAWSYARMVQHLLATGHYQLDDWAAANMPTQIYLAAGLAKIFGYSLTLLRCTSVALLAVALCSFYLLLRELGYTRQIAACATLALLASPLVLLLGFSFQSDAQFLGWFLLALWLYVRGLRRRSAWNIFFASIAAGCAIGTRQFGIAIIVGLIAAWALKRSADRPPLRLLLIAIAFPFLAAAAQVIVGLRAPNITQTLRLYETRELLTFPAHVLAKELLWRCCVLLQYAGMALLPLLPAFFVVPSSFWTQRVARIPLWVCALLAAAAIITAVSFPSVITARARFHHGLWDPLVLHWELYYKLSKIPRIMRLLDLVGIVGGAALTAILLSRLRRLRSPRSLSPELILLCTTALGLFVLHLLYKQLNDTYITAFIPFILLLAASHLRSVSSSAAHLRLCIALSFAAILAMSVWIQADYDLQTASWAAADVLARSGVQTWNIEVVYPWHQYHGAFSEWVAAGAPGYDLHHRERYVDPLHDPFTNWFGQHIEHAQYRIVPSPSLNPPPGWRVVSSVSYRNAEFRRRYVLALERIPTQAAGSY